MIRVLVTGATGFVGRGIMLKLSGNREFSVRVTARRQVSDKPIDVELVPVADLAFDTDWGSAVHGIDVVVHTAARVHVMRDSEIDPLSEFRRINTDGTLSLATQAVDAGVRRFIFLSSIKVNGEETVPGKPFRPGYAAHPLDAYGISKLEAELGLKQISETSGMEVVIIRSPLVYGPGVKANFLSMMTWLYKGVPLPFGAVTHNKRSLVALENLMDLIVTCINHPSAGNQTFLVSDGEDLSTFELLTRLSAALGKRPRLFAIPPSFLMFGARLFGRRELARRLLSSLQIDIARTQELLKWRPPLSVDNALEKTASYFLEQMKR